MPLSQRTVTLLVLGTKLYHRLAALDRARGARERLKALERLGRAAAAVARETGATPMQLQELARSIANGAREA